MLTAEAASKSKKDEKRNDNCIFRLLLFIYKILISEKSKIEDRLYRRTGKMSTKFINGIYLEFTLQYFLCEISKMENVESVIRSVWRIVGENGEQN